MFAMHLVHGAHPELFQDQVNNDLYVFYNCTYIYVNIYTVVGTPLHITTYMCRYMH